MKLKIKAKANWLVVISLIMVSCSYDWKAKVGIIKNDTKDSIVVAVSNKEITDSILYNKLYLDYVIGSNESTIITLPGKVPSQAPDSERVYIYVIKKDSLNKYQGLEHSNSVLKQSFLNKFEIQLNKIKNPLDTIYIR
jgi:hypothetical protein